MPEEWHYLVAHRRKIPAVHARKWEELMESFILGERKDKGTATRFTKETCIFLEDAGSIYLVVTLWVSVSTGFFSTPAGRNGVRMETAYRVL
jgi:hypothetical protein